MIVTVVPLSETSDRGRLPSGSVSLATRLNVALLHCGMLPMLSGLATGGWFPDANLLIVPVALLVPNDAPADGLDNVILKVSLPSHTASAIVGTDTVRLVVAAGKLRVPVL